MCAPAVDGALGWKLHAHGVLTSSGSIEATLTGDRLLAPAVQVLADRDCGVISTTLSHNAGHVEIDAIAVTRRDGQRVLVVIEAKTGSTGAVPKHKLAYPVFALSSAAAQFDEVVPVFLRADHDGESITYDIHECNEPRMVTGDNCLTALTVTSRTRYHVQVTDEMASDAR